MTCANVHHTVNVVREIADEGGSVVDRVLISEDLEPIEALTDEHGRPRKNAGCEATDNALATVGEVVTTMPQVA